MRSIQYVVIALLMIMPVLVSAHEPNYIGGQEKIKIPDPETSRAYYGELTGKPSEFEIAFATTTNFYLNILAPDIAGARSDFDVVMRDAQNVVVVDLRGSEEWERWYEEFAGDTYLKGPETRQVLKPGLYTITISNPDNGGKYVLAPGEAEIFTVGGIPETIAQIYSVKTEFFEKPWYTVFQGIIGKVLLVTSTLLSLIVVFIVYRIVRK